VLEGARPFAPELLRTGLIFARLGGVSAPEGFVRYLPRGFFAVLACVLFSPCTAGGFTSDAVHSLESVLGSVPPNVGGNEALDEIRGWCRPAKQALDIQLAAHPDDNSVRFTRGHRQSMGYNIDEPGAFDGAVTDFKLTLGSEPGNVPAILELATLGVDSDPSLAPNSEKHLCAVQCYHGNEPLEDTQRRLCLGVLLRAQGTGCIATGRVPHGDMAD
jgi:hypothetical protein